MLVYFTNISPIELDNLTQKLYNKGKISIIVRIPFSRIITIQMQNILDKDYDLDIRIKCINKLWENPNQNMDMLSFFTTLLKKQNNDDMIVIIEYAIDFLEKIKQHNKNLRL